MEKFRQLGLSENTLAAIQVKGYEEPSPIQAQIIPLILKGTGDVVGQAQTGTGKTAAFGLPIIDLIKESAGYVQVLVLTPTRELAIQVAEEINSLKGRKRLSILPVYGGQSMDQQLRGLKRGIDIVVGTPGRVLDHINRRTLKLEKVSFVVLDEADEMLNMGFIEDVEEIIGHTGPDRRTFLFSATMPPRILSLAKKYMKSYEVVRVTKEQLTTSLTEQIYFEVHYNDKFEALCRIIDIEHNFYGLVFCRTKNDVDKIATMLVDRGYDAEGIHGDVTQSQRERTMDKFKKQRVNILVATDVAARGLDVNNLTHVINYALPQDPDSYVHRIGRTGRAGNQGTAITFVTPSEYRQLSEIKRNAQADIHKGKLPEVKDIISKKRKRITDELVAGLEEKDEKYTKWARDLLELHGEDILGALLKYSFADELNESNYTEINQRKSGGYEQRRGDSYNQRRGESYEQRRGEALVDTQGTTRLFVAQGKNNGMTPQKLVEFIKDTAHIRDNAVSGVQVFDNFSFVTVPFAKAENIIRSFQDKGRDGKPMITVAKPRK